MCIIIDANCAHKFKDSNCKDGTPVREWVVNGHGKIVIGGKLSTELNRSGLGSLISELSRIGKCVRVEEAKLDAEARHLSNLKILESDDPHIVAAARLSGARLLFSKDENLIRDFKNRNTVLNKVKGGGRVYKTCKNKNLLARDACGKRGCT